MRTKLATAAVLAAVLTIGATACGPETVNTKPSKTSAAKQDAGKDDKTDDAPEDEPKQDAGIGDTLTLHGSEDGSQVEVTLVKWLDNAKPGDEFTAPEQGNKFVAAQLQIVNTGAAVYADSPTNGATVADTEGQQFDPTFATISAGPEMSSGLRLTKGAKGLGWITFEIPKTSKVEKLQFALDSGFADETGQWQITK